MLPAIFLLLLILAVGALLSRLSRAQTEKLRREGLLPEPGRETEEHVDRLLQRGLKIEAIKVYRALHGGGLREAKEAVEERQRHLAPSGPPAPIG